ncbi:asparaginase [uncultured Roseovarius sp.]|uniref:asparaginase n=1 Tax=uncultured Roseovarius sp. TaxID=293344 RepID=UPI00262FD122|nr:asparaginase [uncultured Roseovarius sp.]
MSNPAPLTEIWRGPFEECIHTGHAVICDDTGQIVDAWGDPDAIVMPRSSAKMIQALPLIESGAAEAFGLTDIQLALACASHNGAAIHTDPVTAWLGNLGLGDDDFRCGPQMPKDRPAFNHLIRTDTKPCQMHNNCSGKHAGFLTLSKHLGGGPEYIDPDHPVQKACLEAFEDTTRENSAGFGIDGCSAPNHACTMHGMARAMAGFAAAANGTDLRHRAATRLWQAMVDHPDLVAGERRACTELMRATTEPVALKTGAEGYFTAILPNRKLGIALKITDGATRAANCTIAALLVRLGVLEADHPAARRFMNAPILNRRGINTGVIKPAESLL